MIKENPSSHNITHTRPFSRLWFQQVALAVNRFIQL